MTLELGHGGLTYLLSLELASLLSMRVSQYLLADARLATAPATKSRALASDLYPPLQLARARPPTNAVLSHSQHGTNSLPNPYHIHSRPGTTDVHGPLHSAGFES
ncbi:unnamed protein product [Cercospora beticola]|nr:unnamed protein product [Cercospora beticola]